MENSEKKVSRTPSSTSQNSLFRSGDYSSVSVGSDSSRSSSTKLLYPISFDPDSKLVMSKSESLGDLPLMALPSPLISKRNLGKQVAGIRISSRSYPGSEKYDSSSANSLKFEENEENFKSDDVPDSPMIGSSPYVPSSAKLRSCDVYIGVPSSKPSILRFAKWLRAELELQGVSCFAVDRSKCKDAVGHNIVEKAMDSATYGVVIVTKRSFSNPYSMFELKSFLSRKNLVPIFFELAPTDCIARDIIGKRGELWERSGGELWKSYGGVEKEWKQVVDVLSRIEDLNLEARFENWRDCIFYTLYLLGRKLGKRSLVESVGRWMDRAKEEFPFPRNDKFVGRKKELFELELMLFGDLKKHGGSDCFELQSVCRRKNNNSGVGKKFGKQTKGKEPVVWKESDVEIEMERNPQTHHHHHHHIMGKDENNQTRRMGLRKVRYGKGVACVSGERGMGKTEMLLEFAYRCAQRYKMVLWVGGEARYIRQNYMNLMDVLEIDGSVDNQLCLEINKPRNFEELEVEAIRRLRKEFMRDIPYLVVIDNLESERDWWDGKNIMELLPRFGGETHIVFSTRLPRVVNLDPLKLSYLHAAESMSLMKGRLRDIPVGEVGALRTIEEKLGRLTFGLALVGKILSEHPIGPQGLLDAINRMPDSDLIRREDSWFRRNPFLTKLLELCFLVLGQDNELASRMLLASGWFSPSPIPVMLLTSTSKAPNAHHKSHIWKRCFGVVSSCCKMFQTRRSEEHDSSNVLVKLGFARVATKQGCIQFHEIIKSYARKKADVEVAYAMVHAINAKGSIPEHNEHIWATCFLLFKFGTYLALLKPKASELVSFIKWMALPLATYTFAKFSRCNAALELLRLCSNAVEGAEGPFLSRIDEAIIKSSCWGISYTPTKEFNARLYYESATLKATLFEIRAKLMLQGGDHAIGQQLCRQSISIREVLYGCDHPETISVCNTMSELLRSQE
ncbi:hypothetical protein AQUCO_00900586v1 [Aquilegia coerulea]|uniref:TIR domain-containing protein n=1 Tax=Aquilegia coerulea TaxID=218851 RepID=A0A2G5EED9_AQUCA|nr:hypothetical protein AQUCO_00900586v1 [Aquilegia coerulea]